MISHFKRPMKRLLYGYCPGFAGAFPYFGSKVYFPKNSVSFRAACDQGVFEADNVRILEALVRPDAVMFDVGANIGLMAIPVLKNEPKCRIVSFEPSMNVLPYLERTIAESAFRDRWTLVKKAVGAQTGSVTFNLSDQANSLFDGIRPTQRVATVRQVEVDLTTVDQTWRELGLPRVSNLKIDVEGAEFGVLQGARDCLRAEQPAVLLEWNRVNLAAYDCSPDRLLDFANEMNFQLFAVPGLVEITSLLQLGLHMGFTENFLLLPR